MNLPLPLKILITGASGFAGRQLLECLASKLPTGSLVQATYLPTPAQPHPPQLQQLEYLPHLKSLHLEWHALDATQWLQCESLVQKTQPDWVFHLAGQAFVPYSWSDPASTYEANLLGTHYLLKALGSNGFRGRFLYISTGEIYGEFTPQDLPLKETLYPRPQNPYSVSKLAAEQISLLLAKSYHFEAIIARAFNHIGPAQTPVFVVPEFLQKILQAKKQNHTQIEVGNVSLARDFSDVRDVVEAYFLLMQKGQAGEAYNICSGEAQPIKNILDLLCAEVGIKLEYVLDPKKLRPNEKPLICASNEKLRLHTGWQPRYSLQESLRFLVQYY